MNILSLRKQSGLTQQDLAKKIGCNQHSISSWERGTREPDIHMLCSLADVFDVTLDVLVGRKVLKNNDNEIVSNTRKDFDIDDIFDIKKLRNRRNITQLELATELNVTQSTVSKWEKDCKKITLDQATKIVHYFNLPLISIFQTDQTESNSLFSNYEKVELIKEIETLSEKECLILIKFLEMLQVIKPFETKMEVAKSSPVIIDFKKFRLKLKLSQTDIAKNLGITQQTYANYENGTTQAPYKFLIAFAKMFNTSIDAIIHI